MRFIANKNNLIEAINIANKAVATKTTMPILECMLIDVADDVRFMSNNTDMGIETIVNAKVEEPGKIAIEAKLFMDIVRKMPDGDLDIKVEGEKCVIKNGKSKFNVSVRSADAYPFIEKIERNDPVNISQYELKTVISQVIFSIAANENNKLMTGVLFDVKGDKMNVTALDGHRISIRYIDLNESYSDRKVIIPGKTLNEISKILTGEGEVSMYMTDNNIMFEFDNTLVTSRLVEGEYFNVNQLITNDYSTKIVIDKKSLMECLDRSTLLISINDKRPLIIEIKEDMNVQIITSLGSMDENLDIEKEGEDIKIGLNPHFVIDVLRAVEDEKVNIYFNGEKKPVYVTDDAKTYHYLILPVQF